MLAAAAVLVARYTCAAAIPALRSVPIWSPTLVHYTRYTCAQNPPTYHAACWGTTLRAACFAASVHNLVLSRCGAANVG